VSNDGKKLENLVAFIEAIQLPPGLKVETNSKVFDEDGIQIAEFDVMVSGQVGTTDFSWLIECRDRPNSGTAPVSWIEQLVGRRDRFKLGKVTAVSTTGFSPAATKHASTAGIELRDVKALAVNELQTVFAPLFINVITNQAELVHAELRLDHTQKNVTRINPGSLTDGNDGNSAILWNPSEKRYVSPSDAFLAAVSHSNMFRDMIIGGPEKQVQFRATYLEGDCFFLQTSGGLARVAEIDFVGVLRRVYQTAPALGARSYQKTEKNSMISNSIEYETEFIGGKRLGVQFHSIEATGEIHVTANEVHQNKD
jgi:hypothetical protein